MVSDEFFEAIEQHFNTKLPFVAYRKPDDILVKALLQHDEKLQFTEDFSESGFVFAPFDDREQSVIFSITNSEELQCNIDLFYSEEKVMDTSLPSRLEQKQHIDLVQKGINDIQSHPLQKIVLSRKETMPCSETQTFQIFKQLLNSYKTAFVYCWYHPKVGLWLGATPETLLQTQNKRLKTMALAGTQNYKGTLDVEWKDKEKEEQQMVTDFITENLQADVSQLKVSIPKTVRAGQVLHLQSNISGIMEGDLQSVIKKIHPTPAVCGLPKEAAKNFILSNEGYNREFYTGFLGELHIKQKSTRNTNRRNVENNAYASIKTVSNLYVNLRCMQLKDEKAIIYVGGGITRDSVAIDEWNETVLKAKTIKRVLVSS